MNLKKAELIGLDVLVVASSHSGYVGLSGTVVDETRNTLVIESGGAEKVIPKHGTRFKVMTQGGIEIEGDDIVFRPEDRIKRAR